MQVNANQSGRLPSIRTESDTSDHSYRVAVRPTPDEPQRMHSGSPFADASSSLPPIDRQPLDRPSPPVPLWRRGPGSGRASSDVLPRRNLRVSFELPAGGIPQDIQTEGEIVKKRRRIPLWVVVGFGLATCTGLVIAICLMPLTIYNFRRIRSQRATRTVTDLGNILVPLVEGIYNKTVGPTPSSVFDVGRRR